MRNQDGMAGRRRTAAGAVLAAAAAAALGASSCVSYDVSRVDTYVGPADARRGWSPAAQTQPGLAAPATMPGAALPSVPPTGAIRLNVQQAIVMALGNNKALLVDRYNPPIRRTFEESELAAFDPTLFGELSVGRARLPNGGVVRNPVGNADSAGALVGLTEFLPTGTRLSVTAGGSFSHDPASGEENVSRVGLSATQSLLRGRGLEVNLARLHQARVDTRMSEYELRGLALSILAQTEEAYWDYVLALRSRQIVAESLDLARKQLEEVDGRIAAKRLAESDRSAAEAEVALRLQDLIDANSLVGTSRLVLLRLVSPAGPAALEREVEVEQQPIVIEGNLPLDPLAEHLELAGRLRPELNQARLGVARSDLEVVRTRNGMLPRLDLFVTLGKSGYAESFGRSVGDVFAASAYDALVGISGEWPLGNRGPRAEWERAVLGRGQAAEAVGNLAQLVELDVRTSYIEVQRTRAQIGATAATRRLQEEKLRAETGKFRADKSTSLQVAQVQRDLAASQLAEVRAMAHCLKAYVELYRLDGSLLDRRGIAAPGGETETPNPKSEIRRKHE